MHSVLIAALLPLLLARISFHAVHMSYGDLTISHSTMNGELTFFKDDWNKSIERWYGKPLAGVPQPSRSEMEVQYLKSHVRFWVDSFHTQLSISPYVRSATDLSITYGFSVTLPEGTHAIIADSRVIFSEYRDQMNLVTVKTPRETTNLIFTTDHPTSTITL